MCTVKIALPSYMSKQTWIIIFLIGVIAVLLFWSVEKKEASELYRIQLEHEKATLKHREDSLRTQIKEFQEADLRTLQVIQEATIRADRADAKLQKAINNHDKIVFKPTSSDRERDSLISTVLHN